MPTPEDVFDSFESVIRSRPPTNPWLPTAGGQQYTPDYPLLERLLGVPVGEERGSETGRLAKAIDAGVAYELRRAG